MRRPDERAAELHHVHERFFRVVRRSRHEPLLGRVHGRHLDEGIKGTSLIEWKHRPDAHLWISIMPDKKGWRRSRIDVQVCRAASKQFRRELDAFQHRVLGKDRARILSAKITRAFASQAKTFRGIRANHGISLQCLRYY